MNDKLEDDIFLVEGSDYGTHILYQSQKENVRYFVYIDDSLYPTRNLLIRYGEAYRGNPYVCKRVELKDTNYSSSSFVDYQEDGKLDLTSAKKFKRAVEQIINLKAFL